MGKIPQVDSQGAFPVTIRKLLRLGNAFAVTLPPEWVRSIDPGVVHYLRVAINPGGFITVHNITKETIRGDVQADPNYVDRPRPRPERPDGPRPRSDPPSP